MRIASCNSKPKAYLCVDRSGADIGSPHFKNAYFGMYTASESMHLPDIHIIETYCFSELYGLCPNPVSYLLSNGIGPGVSHKDVNELVRRV